jgi:hypothetical protein
MYPIFNNSYLSIILSIDSILFLMVVVSYYFLLKVQAKNKKFLFLILFVFLSIVFKSLVPLVEIRDYFTYTRVLSDNGYKPIRLLDLLIEPYFKFISKNLLHWFSIPSVLEIYYYFLFVAGISFFTWLAFVKDITLWRKYLIFNLFFILFSFILLRNAIAYMIIALFFYYMSKGRFVYSFFSAVFFHITTIPVLLLSFFRNKKLNFYIVPIVVFIILLFFFIFYTESSFFYLKYKDFKKNSALYNYTIHNVVFYVSLSIFILYIYSFKNILLNYHYVLLLVIYIVLFYFNAVMGFRFSFYIFLYLLMNTQLSFISRLENLLNRYSFLFVLFGIITFRLFLYI